MRIPELLVPASSLEVLQVAVIFGADAVYIGGEAFGLRAKAKNFSLEEMREVWLYGEKECSDLLDREADFWDRYGHFYNCQNEYLEKFGKDFETLYNYCTAGSMSKYTKCVENILDIN